MKLKDFVTGMARKAGFDVTSETAKPFFDGLPDTEVPEDVQKGIDNSLISMTDAKNNHPILKAHYHKQALDGIDSTLADIMTENELTEDIKNEILGEKSTFKRVPLLTKKIAELVAAKAGAGSSKDKKEIQQQIDQLQAQLRTEKEARTADKKAHEQQIASFNIKYKIDTLMGGFKTIHDELDPEIKSTVINTLLNKELQDNQAKFALDDNGALVLLKNDGTNFYGENHQQITPVKFIEQTLAKTKQLKVSSGSNGANNQQRGNQQRQSANDKPDNSGTDTLRNLNAEAMKAFEGNGVV